MHILIHSIDHICFASVGLTHLLVSGYPLTLIPAFYYFLTVSLQVRYTQLVLQKKRKPGGRAGRGVGGAGVASGSTLGRLGRGGSRRSGYAFAHQEGFGELITSGKNMRLSSLALATFASRHSSSWIDTLRRKKHANSTGAQNTPPTGEDSTASSQAPPLSTSSSAAGEAEQPRNDLVLAHSPEDIALSVIRCSEREVGKCSTATVQVNIRLKTSSSTNCIQIHQMQVNMHKYRLLYNTGQSVDSVGAQKLILWIDKKRKFPPRRKRQEAELLKTLSFLTFVHSSSLSSVPQ